MVSLIFLVLFIKYLVKCLKLWVVIEYIFFGEWIMVKVIFKVKGNECFIIFGNFNGENFIFIKLVGEFIELGIEVFCSYFIFDDVRLELV